MEINGGQFLLVHQIPYVNQSKKVMYGSLVCILTLSSPNVIGIPQDHTIFFTGEVPCNSDGIPLSAIINNSNTQVLAPNVIINHYFSSKPIEGNYPNYFEKLRTYAEILSVEAKAIDIDVTSKPKKNVA